jgi:hypothetical protein
METSAPLSAPQVIAAYGRRLDRALDKFVQADRALFEAMRQELAVAERARRRAEWQRALEALRELAREQQASSLV